MRQQPVNHPYITLFFLLLVFWVPIPLGSNREWAWSIMEIWIFLIAISLLIQSYSNKHSIPTSVRRGGKPLLFCLAGFLLWTGIQILPLPVSLLEIISPHAASIAAAGDVDFATIAIDPNLTAKSLLKGIAFTLLLMIMLILIDSGKKIRWLAYTIIVSGLFQATYGSYMVFSGIEHTFFIEKIHHRGMATGTFMNRNHLAGYLEIALAVGIGLMISNLSHGRSKSWRDRTRKLLEAIISPKALIRLSLVIICIGLILTRSRMGNSAFFVSLFITGILFLVTAKHATRSTIIFLLSLVILDILLIGSWVGLGKVVERIEHTSAETEKRDEIARDTLSMFDDYTLTGIGGGNYINVIPGYQGLDVKRHYYHAHNDYLEFAVEYGVIGSLLISMAVLYCMFTAFKAMRKRRSPLSLGMAFASFMGMLSILIHSSVDFNLQIPANAAMFIILMGLAIISLHQHGRDKSNLNPGN